MILSKEYKVQPVYSISCRPSSGSFRVQSRHLKPGAKVRITILISEDSK